MNMKHWFQKQIQNPAKKAIPLLSFPGIQLLHMTVSEMIGSPENQADCMKAIADQFDTSASVSLMDLSVEAEAFGSTIRFSNDEVPTVVGAVVDDEDDAEKLRVPQVGEGRTGVCRDAIVLAKKRIADRPVFAGVIGPFSLSGRLMDMTEIMVKSLMEPELTHIVLQKATRFIAAYALALKAAGADGIVLAEPAAGLLSPAICEAFSSVYVKQIVNTVQDDHFAVIYHNCGNVVPLAETMIGIGAMAYHFGDAVDIGVMLEKMPADVPVMGNLSPAEYFRGGTPESMAEAAKAMIEKNGHHRNYLPSSGCDIPPLSPMENIEAFFAQVARQYEQGSNIMPIIHGTRQRSKGNAARARDSL